MAADNHEKFLPFTTAEFHVLLALVAGERHGYALMQEVREATAGRLKLGPGTLYSMLQRFLERGLVEESSRRPEQNEDQRRRYYRLTARGRRALDADAQRLEAMVRAARRRLTQHA